MSQDDFLSRLRAEAHRNYVSTLAIESPLPPDIEAVCLSNLSDDVAEALRAYPSLRAICTEGNSQLTDAGAAMLAELPELEVLDLEWSTELTDAALEHLARAQKLRYVDLSFCYGFSAEGLERLRRRLPLCEIEI